MKYKIAIPLVVLAFLAVVANNLIVIKLAANHAVNQLKRDYTPGPYEPKRLFDPSKVDPEKLR